MESWSLPKHPMEYEVEYLDDASDVLIAMPTWLQEVTHRHLKELAKSPFDDEETTKLPDEGGFSRRSGFSHGPVEGTVHHVYVYYDALPAQQLVLVWSIWHQKEDAENPGY
jgi:hypothetical protein